MNGMEPCTLNEALWGQRNIGRIQDPKGGMPSTLPTVRWRDLRGGWWPNVARHCVVDGHDHGPYFVDEPEPSLRGMALIYGRVYCPTCGRQAADVDPVGWRGR